MFSTFIKVSHGFRYYMYFRVFCLLLFVSNEQVKQVTPPYLLTSLLGGFSQFLLLIELITSCHRAGGYVYAIL